MDPAVGIYPSNAAAGFEKRRRIGIGSDFHNTGKAVHPDDLAD
jgi:hypothetical protein